MTAGRDALRSALAEALIRDVFGNEEPDMPEWVRARYVANADALLPHVERFAAEQVAAALNDAADELPYAPAAKAAWLRARAAAVLAAPDSGDDQR